MFTAGSRSAPPTVEFPSNWARVRPRGQPLNSSTPTARVAGSELGDGTVLAGGAAQLPVLFTCGSWCVVAPTSPRGLVLELLCVADNITTPCRLLDDTTLRPCATSSSRSCSCSCSSSSAAPSACLPVALAPQRTLSSSSFLSLGRHFTARRPGSHPPPSPLSPPVFSVMAPFNVLMVSPFLPAAHGSSSSGR